MPAERPGRSVLVVGGQGAAGATVAAAFRERGWEVLIAGRRTGADVMLDLARPQELAACLRRVTIAVNLVPDPLLRVERTALSERTVLLNIADRGPAARARLRAVSQPAGAVVLNWGVIPGVANLAAAELLARDPGSDSVRIAVNLSARSTSGKAGGEFLWRNLARRSRHRTARIPTGASSRALRFLEFAEGTSGWLGGLARGDNERAFVRLDEPVLNTALLALNRLRLCSRLPRRLFTVRGGTAGSNASTERFAVWVAVGRGAEVREAASIWGRGMYRCTGRVVVAASEALVADGMAPVPVGCWDPDEVFTLQQLEPALRGAGVVITRTARANG